MKFRLLDLLGCFSIIFFCATGCAKNPHITMPEEYIRGSPLVETPVSEREDEDVTLERLDPADHFRRAAAAYNIGAMREALSHFLAVVIRHPESPDFSESAYRSGVVYEKFSRYEKALDYYRRALDVDTSPARVRDLRFRILGCLFMMKDTAGQQEQVDILEKSTGLNDDDMLELHVRESVLIFQRDGAEKAAPRLEDAYKEWERGWNSQRVLNNYFGAMAAFYLGEVERERSRTVILQLPSEKVMEGLNVKARHLLEAQDKYVRCIKTNNIYWATAAGYRVGELYENLYDDFLGAPHPENQTAEQKEVYDCILAKRITVLMHKAIRIWDDAVRMGTRLRVDNEWTKRTHEKLEVIKARYLKMTERCEVWNEEEAR